MSDKSVKEQDKERVSLLYVLKNNFYILRIAWKACPQRVVAQLVNEIAEKGLRIFFAVVFLRVIINKIQSGAEFDELLQFMIIAAIVFFVWRIVTSWFNKRLEPITNQTLTAQVNLMVYEKATDVELACFENPEFFEKYTKASSQASTKIIDVVKTNADIFGQAFAIIGMSSVMIQLDFFLVIFALFPLLFTFILNKKLNKIQYDLNMANINPNRKKDYVKRTVYLQDFAKEMRLSNIFYVMKKYFDDSVDELFNNIKLYGTKIAVLKFLLTICSFQIPYVLVLLYLAYKVFVLNELLIGDYATLCIAVVNLSGHLSDIMKLFMNLFEHSLYIDTLKDFLSHEPNISESQDGIAPNHSNNILQLKNISFTYEGQTEPVLKDINITLKPNEKIALVGHNGAGKSTLVKLILRLYDVTDGEILLDGKNIKRYNVKKYRKIFGTVFQDFKTLSLSVADNVLMDTASESDSDMVYNALKHSGAYDKVMSLKNGINTTLTREFDEEGAVLSGGEYQKIAIAHVYAAQSQIAVLDEPSSALDPVAEYKMYDNMMKACKDKSVIFISHRLSSTISADKIYMLENGRIIEQGTHNELISLKGKYADMFEKQSEAYREELSAV